MMKRRNSSSPSVSSGPINQISNNRSRNFSSPPDHHPDQSHQQQQQQQRQEQQFCSPPLTTSTAPSQGTSCPSSPPTPLSSCMTTTTSATTTSMTPMNGCEAAAAVRNINHYHPQLLQQQQSSLPTGSGIPVTATTSSSVPSSSSPTNQSHSKSFHSHNITHQNQQSMHPLHHQQQHHQTLDLYARPDPGFSQQNQNQHHASMHHVSSSSSSSGVSSSSCNSSAPHAICYACKKVISERFLLKAMDEYWHEDCLKCSCCDCRLGEVGSTLFTKANLILCKRDYLRLFGSTGTCSACHKIIPAFEMVMRARGNTVFHLECFKCQASDCNHRFCVGDEFYMLNNRILCKFDYEEIMSSNKLMFPGANAGGNSGSQGSGSGALVNGSSSSTTGAHPVNTSSSRDPWCSSSLENLRRQTESLKTEIMNT